MLIRGAQLDGCETGDLRVEHGRVVAIAPTLAPRPGEPLIEAAGAALFPGLHDHHLHLQSLAAALASVACGPPQVADAAALAAALRRKAQELPAGEWIRGVGYHESVAGDLDRQALDALLPTHPVRIQHRSGRLWILNSAALAIVHADEALLDDDERARGRLYDADTWLRSRLQGLRPDLRAVSRQLASWGVTGVTDTSPDNGPDELQHFAAARQRGELLQVLRLMGDARLDAAADLPGLARGERKFHLHDAELPDFDHLCADIRRSHRAGRGCAFHCVSRTDLLFALAALREAGVERGDRIEHASVTPPEALDELRALGLTVVTQPNFVGERGDAYLSEVEAVDQPWLYRLRSFLDAGVPLAGSTDAPFGDANPWGAMQAAVSRRTPSGASIGAEEALTPEQARDLFLGPLEAPGAGPRRLAVGAPADLCLLDRPWEAARADLATVRVRVTWRAGEVIWQGQ